MIVDTVYGKVQGIEEQGMYVFKGIPFAKPPVGKKRFQAPEAPEAWSGVFQADQFGKRSLQTGEQNYQDEIGFSEDCLNLNVWTPGTDGKKRPVVVYLHGGGHFSGANSDRFFDGPHLIRDCEAVMVAPNYRLGALGYLYLKDILGEDFADSGNCGLLDQILALEWVRDNIEAFGGDPKQVVLMGQSAGAKSVANLMVTPRAKGLFCRCIIQSGGVQCIRDTQTASVIAELVLRHMGLGRKDARKLLDADGEEIVKAQKRAYGDYNLAHLFGPVLDGKTIPEPPERYIASGKAGALPVLIGYNREEMCYSAPDQEKTDEEVKRAFRSSYGDNGEIALERYAQYRETLPSSEAFDRVQTEFVYGNAGLQLTQMLAANGARVWSYLWEFGGKGRPVHFSEMPYIFGYDTTESETGYLPKDASYARMMNQTWQSFILTGNPENELLPLWIPCTTSEMGYRMYFGESPHLEHFSLRSYDTKFPVQVIRL